MKKIKQIKRGLRKGLAMLVCMVGTIPICYGQYSDTKEIHKMFSSTTSTVVDIENKYGDITIETWDKDSVQIDILLQVNEKSRNKVRDKMQSITFNIAQSGNYIVSDVTLGENKNIFLSELTKLKENVGLDNTSVEIDMLIKMPDNLELRLINKFGNIYLNNYNGELRLDMSNGKLKANNLTGYSSLKISFGDAIINSIDSGNLEVYYGELHLGSARKLRMTSKTSDISIIQVGQFLVNSRQDDYVIKSIDEMESESNWTDFSISELNKLTDVKMNYGEITIDKINNDFENIRITSKSTKINLYLNAETNINFDIVTNKDLSLPMDATIDSKEEINKNDKIFRLIGRTGSVEVADPKIVINSISGEINIIKR